MEQFDLVLLAIVTGTLSALFPVLIRFSRKIEEKRKTRIKGLKELLLAKLDASDGLSSQDILYTAKGVSATQSDAIEAVYELFSAEIDAERCKKLQKILDDYRRNEPFESYPAEVKPSMAILSKLCTESQSEGAKNALSPIQKIIENYQELQQQHEKNRSLTKNSFVIAVISFLVGAIGLGFAFRSPSKSDINKILYILEQTQQTETDVTSNN